MRDWFAAVAALALSSSCIVGCGGSGAVDFFEGGGGRAGSTASAGSVNSASGSSFVSGGSTASAGSVSTVAGAAGTQSGPSNAPCSPAMDGTNGMSGPFGTLGESCWRVSADITGWGCSNFEGRTIKVNGTPLTCAQLPLPDKVHGDYYFDFSAGEHEYASFFWF